MEAPVGRLAVLAGAVGAQTLSGATGIAGDPLDGHVEARYLFGGAMAERDIAWTFRRSMTFEVPAPIAAKYPLEQWSFIGWVGYDEERVSDEILSQEEVTLDGKGELDLDPETKASHSVPMVYTLEGSVTDVSRQTIANRASLVVHPAPWYIGVRQPPMFADQKTGFDTQILAVTPEGLATPGVDVKVVVTQLQWNSVRRAEGNGFYTWDWELKRIEAGSYDVKTGEKPAHRGRLVASNHGPGRRTTEYQAAPVRDRCGWQAKHWSTPGGRWGITGPWTKRPP